MSGSGIENALIGSAVYELRKHLVLVLILCACFELAVGIGTCAALTELNVALRVKYAEPVERVDLLSTAVNVKSALDNNRSSSAFNLI